MDTVEKDWLDSNQKAIFDQQTREIALNAALTVAKYMQHGTNTVLSDAAVIESYLKGEQCSK